MFTMSLFQAQLCADKIALYWQKPNEELIPLVAGYAQIPLEQAEAYVVSWKYNHPDGKLPGKKASKEGDDEPISATTQEKEFKAIAKSNKKIKEPGAGSIIDQILSLHKAGKSRAEIVAAGFNKSTVARQVGEYEKKNAKK